MVRILSAVLVLSAVHASASPAIPSFEFSAAQLQTTIAAMRAAQVKAAAADVGPQIRSATWDLENLERETSRLKTELTFLLMRARRYQPPSAGRPGSDPSLRWDLQRFTLGLDRVARDSQWRAADLRHLTAQAEKDPNLVAAASRLVDAAGRFKNATNWLAMDARFGYFDLLRAGFSFEAMDIDRSSRDADQNSQDTHVEAARLLNKVSGR